MSKHLERDLIRLSDRVSELGSLVVDATAKCNVMLQNFDRMIADEIVENEQRINDMEVDLEEECLKVMALHQPVASDLRFLIVVLKVNNGRWNRKFSMNKWEMCASKLLDIYI